MDVSNGASNTISSSEILVVHGSEYDDQVVHQKNTLTRMDIEEYSSLSNQFEFEI